MMVIPASSERKYKPGQMGQVLLICHAVMFRCANDTIGRLMRQIVRTSHIRGHGNTAHEIKLASGGLGQRGNLAGSPKATTKFQIALNEPL
jgi:hypothetical protein